jgi:hypothetical protein
MDMSDDRAQARRNLIVNVVLQGTMVAAHAVAVLWLVLVVLGAVDDPFAAAHRWVRAAAWAWSVGGVFWAAINVRGLVGRKAWARKSTVLYWVLPTAFCCCIPIPLWAMWTLTRPAMKRYVSER